MLLSIPKSMTIPRNWYVAQLRTRIASDIGIYDFPASLNKLQLVQMFEYNKQQQTTSQRGWSRLLLLVTITSREFGRARNRNGISRPTDVGDDITSCYGHN